MAIECYDNKCEYHASYKCTDPDDCDGPVCFEEECKNNIKSKDLTE